MATMAGMEADLLPIGGAVLASDDQVLAAVRAIGARSGVDYTDDEAVRALLAVRRRVTMAEQHKPLAWLGGLALVAAVVWPFVAEAVPSLGLRYALVSGPLLILGVAGDRGPGGRRRLDRHGHDHRLREHRPDGPHPDLPLRRHDRQLLLHQHQRLPVRPPDPGRGSD